MARVVAVHGINNTYAGPNQMATTWVPALLDGLRLDAIQHPADPCAQPLPAGEITCVCYGDLFRPAGWSVRGGEGSHPAAEEVEEGFETQLLERWWRAACEVDPEMDSPNARALGVSDLARLALTALTRSRFLAGVAEHTLVLWLRQMRQYFTQDSVRRAVQDRFATGVDADTRVVVAHSLGSVVAYEALCAHPEWGVTTLVTLGSPLGVRNLVFDRLRPPPDNIADEPTGVWPPGIQHWTNITDSGDFVALVRTLRSRFGDGVVDVGVDNGIRAHQVDRYLSAVETGSAIRSGLAPSPRPLDSE